MPVAVGVFVWLQQRRENAEIADAFVVIIVLFMMAYRVPAVGW